MNKDKPRLNLKDFIDIFIIAAITVFIFTIYFLAIFISIDRSETPSQEVEHTIHVESSPATVEWYMTQYSLALTEAAAIVQPHEISIDDYLLLLHELLQLTSEPNKEPVSTSCVYEDDLPPAEIIAAAHERHAARVQENESVSTKVYSNKVAYIGLRKTLTEQELYAMAQVGYAEARGEGMLGLLAVMQCILDRAELWGMSIMQVITWPRQFARSDAVNDLCLQAAREAADGVLALEGYYILNFRMSNHNGDWYKPYITRIGCHVIYGLPRYSDEIDEAIIEVVGEHVEAVEDVTERGEGQDGEL